MTQRHEPTRWTAAQAAGIAASPHRSIDPISAGDLRRIGRELDIWDQWPVQEVDGSIAEFRGGQLWLGLSAPAVGDPVARHGGARLRLLRRRADTWDDLGPAWPDGFSPGSRDWSGSAIVDRDHARVTVFFTAAGRRGEPRLTYEQRIFQASARLKDEADQPRLEDWTEPRQCVKSDGLRYDPADQADGMVGTIKAFRDPGFFRDPADGAAYLLFAASLPQPSSAFNGAVGMARAADETLTAWTLLDPILQADGLNNELERPHVIWRDGLYYLFWSTQEEVFSPDGPRGPTGLYGMVGPSLFGPYEPLNGTGLVFANPARAPFQAYSWLVTKDLTVSSFVNYWGSPGPEAPAGEAARAKFGGCPAPDLTIRLSGTRAW